MIEPHLSPLQGERPWPQILVTWTSHSTTPTFSLSGLNLLFHLSVMEGPNKGFLAPRESSWNQDLGDLSSSTKDPEQENEESEGPWPPSQKSAPPGHYTQPNSSLQQPELPGWKMSYLMKIVLTDIPPPTGSKYQCCKSRRGNFLQPRITIGPCTGPSLALLVPLLLSATFLSFLMLQNINHK